MGGGKRESVGVLCCQHIQYMPFFLDCIEGIKRVRAREYVNIFTFASYNMHDTFLADTSYCYAQGVSIHKTQLLIATPKSFQHQTINPDMCGGSGWGVVVV